MLPIHHFRQDAYLPCGVPVRWVLGFIDSDEHQSNSVDLAPYVYQAVRLDENRVCGLSHLTRSYCDHNLNNFIT